LDQSSWPEDQDHIKGNGLEGDAPSTIEAVAATIA
jgi:hypothetical protein